MTKPTAEATKRPWAYKRVPTSVGQCFKIGSPEQLKNPHGPICIYDDATSLNPRKHGQAEADAALICKAVNEYDALQAVAKYAHHLLGCDVWNSAEPKSTQCTCGLAQLHEALNQLRQQ